jgi:hypothetical protein
MSLLDEIEGGFDNLSSVIGIGEELGYFIPELRDLPNPEWKTELTYTVDGPNGQTYTVGNHYDDTNGYILLCRRIRCNRVYVNEEYRNAKILLTQDITDKQIQIRIIIRYNEEGTKNIMNVYKFIMTDFLTNHDNMIFTKVWWRDGNRYPLSASICSRSLSFRQVDLNFDENGKITSINRSNKHGSDGIQEVAFGLGFKHFYTIDGLFVPEATYRQRRIVGPARFIAETIAAPLPLAEIIAIYAQF